MNLNDIDLNLLASANGTGGWEQLGIALPDEGANGGTGYGGTVTLAANQGGTRFHTFQFFPAAARLKPGLPGACPSAKLYREL